MPIFGVRGRNSGFDDAPNLAWKLAAVLRGDAGDGLLDSCSVERVHAARENIAYGARSTEFMAPPVSPSGCCARRRCGWRWWTTGCGR